MREITEKFKALSDPNRIRILKMLQKRSMCVCEMQAVLQLATSTVSKHLQILRNAGFIYDIKEQKWVNYYINDKTEDPIISSLLSLVHEKVSDTHTVEMDLKLAETLDRNQLCSLGDKIELEK